MWYDKPLTLIIYPRKEPIMSKNTTQNTLQKTPVVVLLALVCCFLWGSAFPSIKLGYEHFSIASGDTAAQMLFAGLRFTLAGLLVILFGSLLHKKALIPARTSWTMVLRLSLAQTVIQYIFFYIGLANTSGVKGSIIEGSSVFMAILVSSLLFHYEKLGRWKILGCVLGFAGVILINLNGTGLGGGFTFIGDGFIALSALSSSFSHVMIKGFSQREDPVTLSGWQFFLGGLVLTAIGLLAGGRLHIVSPLSLLLLLYMSLISAVAYTVWGILLKHNPVSKVSIFGFMIPLFGVLLSAALLGEQNQAFTLQGLVSLVLVCLGIYIVNRDVSGEEAADKSKV